MDSLRMMANDRESFCVSPTRTNHANFNATSRQCHSVKINYRFKPFCCSMNCGFRREVIEIRGLNGTFGVIWMIEIYRSDNDLDQFQSNEYKRQGSSDKMRSTARPRIYGLWCVIGQLHCGSRLNLIDHWNQQLRQRLIDRGASLAEMISVSAEKKTSWNLLLMHDDDQTEKIDIIFLFQTHCVIEMRNTSTSGTVNDTISTVTLKAVTSTTTAAA